MSQLVVGGISELFVVSESGATELLTDAAFIVENGVFTWIGKDADLPATRTIDCKKRAVIPGFVYSHTHHIFAGD